MDEGKAIRLLKAGDLAGLDALTQQYYDRAVRAAYLIVHDRAEAEDIVQNAFLHAYDKIRQLASERFGPWFLRSVVHASIKAARKQARHVLLSAPAGEAGGFFEDLLEDRLPGPEAQVEQAELRQAVWEALQRLPAEQRAAVVMKYYLGFSEAEITAALHQPLSTVKGRLYAARQRLKSLLRLSTGPTSHES